MKKVMIHQMTKRSRILILQDQRSNTLTKQVRIPVQTNPKMDTAQKNKSSTHISKSVPVLKKRNCIENVIYIRMLFIYIYSSDCTLSLSTVVETLFMMFPFQSYLQDIPVQSVHRNVIWLWRRYGMDIAMQNRD